MRKHKQRFLISQNVHIRNVVYAIFTTQYEFFGCLKKKGENKAKPITMGDKQRQTFVE